MDFLDGMKFGFFFGSSILIGSFCGWLLTRGLSMLLNWAIPAVLSLMGH